MKKRFRLVELDKLASRRFLETVETANHFTIKEPFGVLVGEAPYHLKIIQGHTLYVKRNTARAAVCGRPDV